MSKIELVITLQLVCSIKDESGTDFKKSQREARCKCNEIQPKNCFFFFSAYLGVREMVSTTKIQMFVVSQETLTKL